MRARRIPPLVGLGLLGAACDFPTAAPIIEQRWAIPLDEVTLEQSELLPSSVVVRGSLYDVSVSPVGVSETLGNLCPPCAALDGQTAPVPAYQGSFSTTSLLPTDVVSVGVASGSIDVTLTNGLSFDPIAGGGSLTITVAGASGGPVLGTVVFDGATDTLAPGSSATRTMPLSSGTIDATTTTVDVVGVGGQVATIDVTDRVALDATTTELLVSTATVDVDGLPASLTERPLDSEDLDASLIDGVVAGSALLEIANPFGVTFSGSFTVGSVTKALSVPSDPTASVSISFTGDELRSFLGRPGVTFSGAGTIGGGPAVLVPDFELAIDATIDLSIEIGG